MNGTGEKFCWKTEMLKNNQTKVLEMQNSIYQIKNTEETLNNRLDEDKENLSWSRRLLNYHSCTREEEERGRGGEVQK